MFIVTAQLVKPVNRDDLPQMRGIDGLKKGSPLGIEPKGEGIQGKTGFSISGQTGESTSAPTVNPVPKVEDKPEAKPESKPATKTNSTTDAASGSPSGSVSESTKVNPALPVARVFPVNAWPNVDPLQVP